MSIKTISDDELVIACIPNNVPEEKRERWMEIGTQVYAAVEEVRELPDGYACRLPNDERMLLKTAEYISLDRYCCAFYRWSLVVEPNGGPLWLHITGSEDTKALTRHTFETTTVLKEQVAIAAGFDISARVDWTFPDDPTLNAVD